MGYNLPILKGFKEINTTCHLILELVKIYITTYVASVIRRFGYFIHVLTYDIIMLSGSFYVNNMKRVLDLE